LSIVSYHRNISSYIISFKFIISFLFINCPFWLPFGTSKFLGEILLVSRAFVKVLRLEKHHFIFYCRCARFTRKLTGNKISLRAERRKRHTANKWIGKTNWGIKVDCV